MFKSIVRLSQLPDMAHASPACMLDNDNAQYARDLESLAEANESRLSRVDIIYRLLYAGFGLLAY
jgi:hypothetical protein